MNPSATRQKTPAHQLRDAASSGDLAELRRLVWEGVPVNDRSSFNNTALLHAAKHGKRECVRFLIQNNADVNIDNDSGYTPLISSALIGDYESVKMLLEAGAETWHTLKEEDGSPRRVQQTALTLAERNKHYRVAELLRTRRSLISPGSTFSFTGNRLSEANDGAVFPKTATPAIVTAITVTYELNIFRSKTKRKIVK